MVPDPAILLGQFWATALFFAICLWADGRHYVADAAVGDLEVPVPRG